MSNPSSGTAPVSVQLIGSSTFPSNTTFASTTVGGLSGITYDASSNRYYVVSDAKNDPTGPVRFYTVNIDLTAGALGSAGVTFTGMTPVRDASGTPLAPNVADPEGIALAGAGEVWIASEGMFSTSSQPFIDRFSLTTGNRIQGLTIPAPRFSVSSDTAQGIRNNRGFESLTLTPDGRYLFVATEVALEQDGAAPTSTAGSACRIVRYDLNTGAIDAEFVYHTDPGSGISELLALDANTLLVLDRSVTIGAGKLYQADLSAATNIQAIDSLATGGGSVVSAAKTLVADLLSLGLPNNFEGMTLGETLPNGKRSLILVADNNFGAGFGIPSQFAAFELTLSVSPPPPPPADTVAPTVSIAPVSPAQRESAVPAVAIAFSEAVTGFDLADLRLTRNGTEVALTAATLTSADGITWSLGNLGGLTDAPGRYALSLLTSDIADGAGNGLSAGTAVEWLTGRTATAPAPIDFGGRRGVRRRGTAAGDRLVGTAKADGLSGRGGDDQLVGKAGNDQLSGDGGGDRLVGGGGSDRLIGGAGNDVLIGGAGSDVLIGGLGSDELIGGADSDLFTFTRIADGIDRIRDFNPAADLIDLRLIFTSPAYAGDSAFARFQQFVRLVQVGSDTEVRVDADGSGGGTAFATLATLQNLSASAIDARQFVLV